METIKQQIEETLKQKNVVSCFLGTYDYKDLIQSDQDMLLGWTDNGGELTKEIEGIKFKVNVLF